MSVDRGTIVYTADPFKDADSGRPWVIISTPAMPFHGEQYIALTLSTKTWYENQIPVGADDVIDGGLPDESSILPWAVLSPGPDAIAVNLESSTRTLLTMLPVHSSRISESVQRTSNNTPSAVLSFKLWMLVAEQMDLVAENGPRSLSVSAERERALAARLEPRGPAVSRRAGHRYEIEIAGIEHA